MANGEKQPAKFWERVDVRALFLSQRRGKPVGTSQDADHVQAESEERLKDEIVGKTSSVIDRGIATVNGLKQEIEGAKTLTMILRGDAERFATDARGSTDSAARHEEGSKASANAAQNSEKASGKNASRAQSFMDRARKIFIGTKNTASKAQSFKDIAGNHAKSAKDSRDGAEAAAVNSKTLFDRRIGPAVDASVKPTKKAIGRALGRILGETRKEKAATKSFTDQAEDAAKRSEDAAKRATDPELSEKDLQHKLFHLDSDVTTNELERKLEETEERLGGRIDNVTTQVGPQGLEGKKGKDGTTRIPRWMVAALIGLAALAASGLFLPRSGGEGVTVVATPTPSAAAGTPTPEKGFPTLVPTAESKVLPTGIVRYDFPTAIGSNAEVAKLRGGNPDLWIRAEEEFLITRPKTDGTIESVTFKKVEWRYDLNKGKMGDLKVHAMIPQNSASASAALELGSTADAYNLQPIKITHNKKSPQYASWMDDWSMVPEGTIIGWHGIERKGNNGGAYDLNIPAGGTVEFYDDSGTVSEEDDVAVTVWNPSSETAASPQTMKVRAAGFTWWPWGNPEKISLQQSNYQQNVNVPGAYARVAGLDGEIHLIPLKVASNIASPDAAHRYVTFDDTTGKAVILPSSMNIPPSITN